ncbi:MULTISPECIES: helix-turn-helix domain-containing protein [unclassified Rhizobium]|uniref:helix-turn-helix domain-containing protein n=1 Tax=unclassified Rhizobium TaxID=2613769 RepID=UPI001358EE55|nr:MULTISPECIES: helix-turn-helix transcriptional regulator [unclassified Rhizobium]
MIKNVKRASPIDIHVGEMIRLRRRAIGMSQERLGQGLGITFQQIQKYEKGTNRVGASRMLNLATILGVPVSYFFPVQPDQPNALSSVPAGSDELVGFLTTIEGRMLNTAFARVDGPIKQKIVSLVVAIARAGEDA